VKLIVSPIAVKALSQAPRKVAMDLMAKLQAVAADPMGPHPWAKRLTDHPGFRLRQGDWRAVYRLDHGRNEMIVDKIAKRDEVYK
jgi:mRNA interferase RelE/StbE